MWRVNHPVLLCPASTREFDERDDAGDAFGSGAAVCWWAGAAAPVRLNGRTGLLWDGGITTGSPSGSDSAGGGGSRGHCCSPGASGTPGGGSPGGGDPGSGGSRGHGGSPGGCSSSVAVHGGSKVGAIGLAGTGDAMAGHGGCRGCGNATAHEGDGGAPRALMSPVCKAALFDEYAELCALAGVPLLPGEDAPPPAEHAGTMTTAAARHASEPAAAPGALPGSCSSRDRPSRGSPGGRDTAGHPGSDMLEACAAGATRAACPEATLSWAQLYRRAKHQACPAYDAARGQLLSSPSFFAPGEGTAGHPAGSARRLRSGFVRKA
eukprot:352886-Chlamydomonas_euryale.AAC.1